MVPPGSSPKGKVSSTIRLTQALIGADRGIPCHARSNSYSPFQSRQAGHPGLASGTSPAVLVAPACPTPVPGRGGRIQESPPEPAPFSRRAAPRSGQAHPPDGVPLVVGPPHPLAPPSLLLRRWPLSLRISKTCLDNQREGAILWLKRGGGQGCLRHQLIWEIRGTDLYAFGSCPCSQRRIGLAGLPPISP